MNTQASHIGIAGNKRVVAEAIRCEQLTKRYLDGDILAVARLDLRLYSWEAFGSL